MTEKKRKLTEKQLKFIEVYSGNATKAAREAGYDGNDNVLGAIGYENLRKPQIVQAIRERHDIEQAPLIASRKARQAFWTRVMNNDQADYSARLRASELLGKSEADFTEKVEHSGKLTLEEMLAGSFRDKEEPTEGESDE